MSYFDKLKNSNARHITKYTTQLSLLLVVLELGACCSIPQNEGSPAKVADVVSKIKADIGAYQKYDALASEAKPLNNACQAAVGFYIDNVKVSLTTSTDDTSSVSGSATLPVGSSTFGPSLSGSQETKGTQTLTFALYPKAGQKHTDSNEAPTAIDASLYPIAASLQRLRDGLLEASQKKPCLSLIPVLPDADGKPQADAGGTYAFGFTVINNASAGGTLKFVIFSLGATNTVQRQAGNTITVTFKARPGSAAAAMTE